MSTDMSRGVRMYVFEGKSFKEEIFNIENLKVELLRSTETSRIA
jgi:hypothetical protein